MARTASGRKSSPKAKAASKAASSRSGSKRPQGPRSKPTRASSPRRFAKPVLLVLAVLAFVLVAALGLANMQSEEEPPALRPDGLPSCITDEMVQAAQDMQKQYGHPAGCTLAQIIQESGQGTGLSALAEQDNNLFGMKWAASFEGKPGVVGRSIGAPTKSTTAPRFPSRARSSASKARRRASSFVRACFCKLPPMRTILRSSARSRRAIPL